MLALKCKTFGKRFSSGLAKSISVKGLSWKTDSIDLANCFRPFGKIENVSLQAKGIGYIEFSNESEARKAVVRMNGMYMQGRVVYVDFCSLDDNGDEDGDKNGYENGDENRDENNE